MIKFSQFVDARALTESRQMGRQASTPHTGKRTRDEEIEFGKDSNYNFTYDNGEVAFVSGIHAAAQAKDRRPDMSKEDWKKLHRKVYWFIRDNKIERGVYLFYSKEMRQGYIADVRRAKSSDNVKAKKVVASITVLPRGKHDPRGGNNPGETELAMMEIQAAFEEAGILFESIDSIKIYFV